MSCGKATTLLCLLLVLPVLLSVDTSDGTTGPIIDGTRGQYELHEPILIEGDSDFTAGNGVVSGTGTESDPYIIEGFFFDGGGPYHNPLFGIFIANTTKYITVQNCRFNYAAFGASLFNAENVVIRENLFENSSNCHVFLNRSDNNLIQNNEMNGNRLCGIRLAKDNHWNDIMFNKIRGHGLQGSSGIFLEGMGNNCTRLVGNEVDSYGYGIRIHHGFNLIIRNNSCHNNSNGGLYLNNTRQSLIAGNQLCDNFGFGLCYVVDSSGDLIFNNFIEGNKKNGVVTTANSNLFYNSIRNNLGSGIFSLNGHFPNLYKNIVQGNGRFDAESEDNRINISDIDYESGSYPFIAKVDPNVTIPIREVPVVGLLEFDFLEEYRECLFYYSSYDEGVDEKIHSAGISSHKVASDYTVGKLDRHEETFLIDTDLLIFNYSNRSGLSYFVVTHVYESGFETVWNVTMNYIPTPIDNSTPPDNGTTDDGNTTDDPSEDNKTDDFSWTAETNRPPTNASISTPEKEVKGGETFTLSASSLDLDLTYGDSVRYEWYIDGIGLVGEGEFLNLTLDKGTYTLRLRAIDSYNGTCEIIVVLDVAGKDRVDEKSSLPFVLIASGLVLFLCIISLFIYKRERKRKEEAPSHVDDLIDVPTPRMTPHTFEGGSVTQVWSERLSPDGLPRNGPMDVQFDTLRERIVYSEIETAPFEGVKLPRDSRRTELKKALKARRDTYDGEIYSALRSILHEE
ncbi:MAG: right-handed parallel beta-helix repeat-containing protein [Candidatus Thermoplasmatota archaeon]|nr:right-handed parallel beta-helix repeat-containing protein [Candidatus Thermoplasmatota archaeon]